MTMIDGRRQRTVDSRASIVSAMLNLTAEGHITVGAEEVARRAGVGLRTVFRHFNDMDSLYREMSLVVEAQLRAEILDEPPPAEWPARLFDLIDRRVAVYERITPYRRAEAAHRHRSPALRKDIARLTTAFRHSLTSALPLALADDPVLFEALDMLLSFDAWDRLRRDQGLDIVHARQVLEAVATKLIAGY